MMMMMMMMMMIIIILFEAVEQGERVKERRSGRKKEGKKRE